MEHVPNDLLIEILKSFGLNYVDRFNCLLTCKQFKQAVLTPRLWTHVTIQTSPVFYVREEEEQRKDPKPKELSIHAVALMQFLHKNFARDVVELDLSGGHFESEYNYRRRKFEVYNGAYSANAYFWEIMFEFPNLTKLSLKDVDCRDYGNAELTALTLHEGKKSNITHLNLLNQRLFEINKGSLELILEACPKLEQLQVKSDEELIDDAAVLFSKYTPNIKELLCVKGSLSASQLSMSCPKLEVLILPKGKRSPWDTDEDEAQPNLRPEISYYKGWSDNIWVNKHFGTKHAKPLQKAIQNSAYSDYHGTPLIAKMLEVKAPTARVDELLELFVKKMGMDIDEQVKSKDEVRFNPFKLQFPYDASYDKEQWGEPEFGPLYFYQTDGDSALHLAVKRAHATDPEHGSRKLLSSLLKHGANVNLKNKEGKTPICYALNSKVIKTLVDAGADVKVIDNNGWNVLMNVIANPSRFKRDFDEETMMKMFNLLTEKLSIDINYEAPDGMNALNVALLCGQLERAKKIQNKMKKPEPSTNSGPRLSTLTCLCLSRVREVDIDTQTEMIGELLDAGFDALSQDDKGRNALHIACLYRRFDLAKELITRCKQSSQLLSAKDNDGYTPLHYVVTLYAKTASVWSDCKQYEDIAEKLRTQFNHFESYDINTTLDDVINAAAVVESTQGCVFNVVSKNGETPLHSLCRSYQNDKSSVVKQLVLNSANPDIQDIYGQTPLLISCFNLDVEVVKLLLEHKVNVNAADMHGVTPVLAACHGLNKELSDIRTHQVNSYRMKSEEERKLKKSMEEAVVSFQTIVTLLGEHKADFTVKDRLTWRTPLHIIAGMASDLSDQIEKLVQDFKVDINARDVQNDAPIHFAVRKLNSKHLRKLIGLGADINAVGYYGRTPLINLARAQDYAFFKGNGEIMKGGYKILGHSLVYYPSWIWNSVELGLPDPNRNRFSVSTDNEERALMEELLLVFFEHADKVDFGIRDSEGALASHVMADAWREEDNQSSTIINSPLVKKLLTPVQLKLPVPNLFLKYATKEQINMKGSYGSSVLQKLVRVFQIIDGPYAVPKEAAVQFLQDFMAKGLDLTSDWAKDLIRDFTSMSRPVWPEVLEILFQNLPKPSYQDSFIRSHSRTTVMHNVLGSNGEYCTHIKQISALMMQYVPDLLNAYDSEGRTPLMSALDSLTHSPYLDKVSKLAATVEVLLAQPGIEVNKKHRDTGATALHYAAFNSSFACLIGLFYNNSAYYNNIGVDQVLLALLDAGADVTIKDNQGRTPLDILPSLIVVSKERRKVLQREEKLSLIDKPVLMVDVSGQQSKAMELAYNTQKLHAFKEEAEDAEEDGGIGGLFD